MFECVYEGTRGPGKTDALLMDFAQHVGQGFGQHWRGILFRRTYKQLADVVAKSRRWFHQIFPAATFNQTEKAWTWPAGEQLILSYMDTPADYWNYHGHEYPWIGWEELTNWPTLECYHLMKSCSRSSHPGMPRKYRATCNPYGVGHNAVKAQFIDSAPAGVPFKPAEFPLPEGISVANGGEPLLAVRLTGHYSENRALLAADPDYPQKLAQAATSPAQAKAWLNGDWDIVAGGLLDDIWQEGRLSHQRHKLVVEPFAIPPTWRMDRSFDWGSSKPFSVAWWAESNGEEVELRDGTKRAWPRGHLFRVAEWYGWNGKPNEGCRMLAVEIARGILEREQALAETHEKRAIHPGPADPAIYSVEDGKSIADGMATVGVRWERADNSPGSRVSGAEELRRRLKAGLQHPQEDPGLSIFSTCIHWLRTVPTIPRDEKKPDDADTDAEDHCYDETRYRLGKVSKRGYVLRLR